MRFVKLIALLFSAGYAGMAFDQQSFVWNEQGTKAQHLPPAKATIVVRPQPYTGVLTNPDIGFTTFQMFNGDERRSVPDSGLISYQPYRGTLENKDYPATTIAYWRALWRNIEPEDGVYRWDLIDRALQTAHDRGQTLMLRIAPYSITYVKNVSGERIMGVSPSVDVPDWYRKVSGEPLTEEQLDKGNEEIHKNDPAWKPHDAKWVVDPLNPAYAYYYGRLIRALGARYDGHPDLDLVDIAIVGASGEDIGKEKIPKPVHYAILDSYLESFHKTPLAMQPIRYSPEYGRETIQYVRSKSQNVGWRFDCLGDLGVFSPHFNHMNDIYPEAITEDGLSDAWKTAPVSMESCSTISDWYKRGFDISYIVDQAIKWHVSSFNNKWPPVPKEWWPEINRWLEHMGYRFVLRRFTYPATVEANRAIAFTSWWENTGNAPIYRDFPLALRLTDGKNTAILSTDSDIRKWLPGDAIYNSAVYIPADLPDGDYDISLAVIDPQARTPKVRLAVTGTSPDGWFPLGKIKVKQALPPERPEASATTNK
jgi:hypothetical protein